MTLPLLKNLDVSNKTVLVRVGFDVPIQNGRVVDDSRIKDALPTLNYLLESRAKMIVMAHLGRPQGWEEKLSLLPAAEQLAEILGRKFIIVEATTPKLPEYDIPHLYFFKHDILKTNIRPFIEQLRPSDIAVLENLRFYPQEEESDPTFAEKLASLGEVYVNEAFSVSHRAHASIVGIPKILPAAAGLSLEKEVRVLSLVLEHPKKPVVVMMGGVKLADKALALENLAKLADYVLLGGGLANLMLAAKGFEIGKSVGRDEERSVQLSRQLLRNYKDKIKLPIDMIVSNSLESGEAEVVKVEKVKVNQYILDIGPETIRQYSQYLKMGKTLVWNGPMGYFEKKPYSHGTLALARLFASRGRGLAFAVAGGGETLEAISKTGVGEYIDHISTGGGAMLDFLAGKTLPGLEVLS